jgi:hypothetical protein
VLLELVLDLGAPLGGQGARVALAQPLVRHLEVSQRRQPGLDQVDVDRMGGIDGAAPPVERLGGGGAAGRVGGRRGGGLG